MFDKDAKLCYTDTDSFATHIKTEDFHEDIADDVVERFDTANYEINGPLPIGKNKKKIGLMKGRLGGKIMKEIVALRSKAYSCLLDGDSEIKKAKAMNKFVTKIKNLIFWITKIPY